MRNMSRCSFRWLTVVVATVLFPLPGGAQDFPAKPIRIIVANAAGSPMDAVARILAPEMSRSIGQPITVEDKPGAGQILGYEYVAKQVPADGYTLVLASVGGLATLPLTAKDLRFDPLKDLPPVLGVAEGRLVMGSAASLPWKTFNEFVAQAKANPGKLNYGSPAPSIRLTAEALIRALDITVTRIDYSGGGAPYFLGIVGGDVHMGFVGVAQIESFGAKFRPLAMTGEVRHEIYRDVPTFKELGHPQIRGSGYSLNAPAGVSKAVVQKLYGAASRALQHPDMKAQLAKIKLEVLNQPPDIAASRLAEEAAMYSDIARKVGFEAK